jgi:glycosyltransferase involved in cell wall biosynthesis
MSELVSILVPAYNSERWLAATLQSALDQTWPQVEIIVVDDGSRDGTLAVARTFERRNVKVVTQPNQGAPAARNHALTLAQGTYIQWLDADDLLHPNKISAQMQVAAQCAHRRLLLSGRHGLFYFRPERATFTPTTLWADLTPRGLRKTCFCRPASGWSAASSPPRPGPGAPSVGPAMTASTSAAWWLPAMA